jgi:hypothetical protein
MEDLAKQVFENTKNIAVLTSQVAVLVRVSFMIFGTFIVQVGVVFTTTILKNNKEKKNG